MILQKKGHLFIFSAPSGAGKTSLARALVHDDGHIILSVSYTTRPPRGKERDGEAYHFITRSVFSRMVEEDRFVEHAKVFDQYYGTSKAWVDEQFGKGTDVILEIDWQGAQQVKQQYKDAVGVFILPPAYQALRDRLSGRQESEMTIKQRMQGAKNEIAHALEYDYIVVNDVFDQSLDKIKAIVQATRLNTRLHRGYYTILTQNLLSNSL